MQISSEVESRTTPWIWVVVSGIITLLVGLIILAHSPVSSLCILGLFLDIDLVFAGAGWIGLGLGLRRRAPAHQVSIGLVVATTLGVVRMGYGVTPQPGYGYPPR